jgi:hypothetical protein
MPSAQQPSLFLDTSIQIARHVHGPKTKEAINQRLREHSRHVVSLVVRQEFKRRLLKEAEYLLRQLHRYQSFDEVHQHVIRLFGTWPGRIRKRNICLQTLAQVHEGTDAERTERLRLYLRSLLVDGLRRFDQMVDEVRTESSCACARLEVIEREKLRRYDFGKERCSLTKPGSCGIRQFLAQRQEWVQKILGHLRSLAPDKKSSEVQTAEKFLDKLAAQPDQVEQDDPCLTVGDLLIALESVGISHFLTLNGVESQHYCRALGQTLIVHPVDPTKMPTVCPANSPQWPPFGFGIGKQAE